jgi:glycosyltransferase involved in cell wall biosynthesis
LVANSRPARIGIFYPSDPAGNVPSGIDSFIKGILKFAPEDLDYLLVGASSDTQARPVGSTLTIDYPRHKAGFLPIVDMDADGRRRRIPLTIRYLWALRRILRTGFGDRLDILDFHRIEPLVLFGDDPRPKNLLMHQDMSVVRDRNSDIMWRHAPAVYEYFENRLMQRTDRIYCVRQSAVDRYRRNYPHIGERIQFIPTWVDTEVFRPPRDPDDFASNRLSHRDALGLRRDVRLLVFVGRLDRQKDPLLLLDAFARSAARDSSLHMIVIGDGVLRSEVEGAIAEHGLGARVTLLGALAAGKIAEWLRASDLFVLSSAYEGMPIAVLEALACGLPVASTDVGEIRRVVSDGRTGTLATSRNGEALSAAIDSALGASDPAERALRCVDAIQPYRPEAVLGTLFENHRRQAAERRP